MQVQTEISSAVPKRPFDIHEMMKRIERAVKPFPKAMLFNLFDRGYRSPFEILVAYMISIRTRDELSLEVSLRLFKEARLPKEIAAMNRKALAQLLRPATYFEQKAERLVRVAQFVDRSWDGALPCDEHVLMALPGVGPKAANLILGIACGKAAIGVDVHVQRVTKRWGYIEGGSANATEYQLQRKLPKEYWVKLNGLLVPFGKHICTSKRPHCSTCPVLQYCRQVGVTAWR